VLEYNLGQFKLLWTTLQDFELDTNSSKTCFPTFYHLAEDHLLWGSDSSIGFTRSRLISGTLQSTGAYNQVQWDTVTSVITDVQLPKIINECASDGEESLVHNEVGKKTASGCTIQD
jgi:hypothetical protein